MDGGLDLEKLLDHIFQVVCPKKDNFSNIESSADSYILF
jgi:hypothetical protein